MKNNRKSQFAVSMLVIVAIALILSVEVGNSELDARGASLPSLPSLQPFSAQHSNDAHDPRPDACRTYRFGGYDMSDGEECGLKGSRTFQSVVSVVSAVSAPVSVTPVSVTPVITTVPTPDPVTPVVVIVVDNNKGNGSSCNNGNGNGDEGCNSSEKGNQDETKVKGDKGPEHPGKGNNANNNGKNNK